MKTFFLIWLSVLFTSLLFGGDFGVALRTDGRSVAVDPEGNARIIQPMTLVFDREEIFTDPGSRLLITTLDGSRIYVFENTHLKLLGIQEVGIERDFTTNISLEQGAAVFFFTKKNNETSLIHGDYHLEIKRSAFLFFSSFEKNLLNLFSPNKELRFEDKNLPKPLFLKSGKAIKNYDGRSLSFDGYEYKPELQLSIFLDRKDLFFRKDEIRTLLITIQLIRTKTKQNYGYPLQLQLFSNLNSIEIPDKIILNERGYGFLELKIPNPEETRFRQESFELYIFADLSETYTIYPGYVNLPFYRPKDSTADN